MIAQWENECISLSVLSIARVQSAREYFEGFFLGWSLSAGVSEMAPHSLWILSRKAKSPPTGKGCPEKLSYVNNFLLLLNYLMIQFPLLDFAVSVHCCWHLCHSQSVSLVNFSPFSLQWLRIRWTAVLVYFSTVRFVIRSHPLLSLKSNTV